MPRSKPSTSSLWKDKTREFTLYIFVFNFQQKRVPLQGEEIGRLTANAFESRIADRDHGMAQQRSCSVLAPDQSKPTLER